MTHHFMWFLPLLFSLAGILHVWPMTHYFMCDLQLCCIPQLETAFDLPCTGTHEGCLGRLCKGPKEEIALDTLSVAFHAGCDSGQ